MADGLHDAVEGPAEAGEWGGLQADFYRVEGVADWRGGQR